DIQQANPPVGTLACPNAPIPCIFSTPCGPTGQCVSGQCVCTSNAQCPAGASCVAGVCGKPSCRGFGDIAQLPKSGAVVVAPYFGHGDFLVVDTNGTPLTSYQAPRVCDPCCNSNGSSCPASCANPPCCSVNGCDNCSYLVNSGGAFAVDPSAPLGDE